MTRLRLWALRAAFVPRRVWRAVRIRLPRRLRWAILVIGLYLAVGTAGYRLIEGPHWSWFDGLYMTAITLTTLGFGETHPLSTPGRVFTIVLAFGGIFVLFYVGTETVRAVVTGELQELIGRERMEAEIAALSGHLIVCGYGRMGKIVCEELERQKKRFVTIDKSAEPITDWPYKYGFEVQGDATEDAVLRKARIAHAAGLITVVASDADNLYIALSARLLNPKLTIIARAEEEEAERKLQKVGATKVISPYLIGGHRAVQAALRPAALDFLDLATRSEFLELQIEEVKVAAGSRLAGATIAETGLHRDLGVLIVGILRATGELLSNPTADARIAAGDTLITLGQRRHTAELEKLAGAAGRGQ
jgi:voltage-gated potassium channel